MLLDTRRGALVAVAVALCWPAPAARAFHLCSPAADPCIIAADETVSGTVDLGTRVLRVAAGKTLTVTSPGLTLSAGAIVLEGGAAIRPSADDLIDIALTATGQIALAANSLVDASGFDGGVIQLVTTGGDVEALGSLRARAQNVEGRGGIVEVVAAGSIRIAGSGVSVDGPSLGGGGDVALVAGHSISIESPVVARHGGNIDVVAGAQVTIASDLDVSGAEGGGVNDIEGCDIFITGEGELDSSGSVEFPGGQNVLGARRSLVAHGTLTANPDGQNIIRYRSLPDLGAASISPDPMLIQDLEMPACTTTTTTTTSSTTTSSTSTSTTTTSPPTTSTTTTSSTTTSTATSSTSTTTPSTTSTTLPPATTSTTSSTTTTIAAPVCGNGVTEPGEECDYRDPAFGSVCCTGNCLGGPRFGQPCGGEEGVCDAGRSCDGTGRCVSEPKAKGTPCRRRGDRGPCDEGGECDGAALQCPLDRQDTGCDADVPEESNPAITFSCDAPGDTVSGGTSECEARGFEGASTATASLGGTAGAIVEQGCRSNAGAALTGCARKKLKTTRDGSLRRTVLRLKLNAQGRKELKESGGRFRLLVVVRINHAGAVRNFSRFVTVRRGRKRQ